MDRAIAPASAPPAVIFRDGLGERHLAVNAANEPLEVLAIGKELTAVPLFEIAVREQVSRLAPFQHESHARVRGVLHVNKPAPTLAVASERIAGTRLSDVLSGAREHHVSLEFKAACCLIRQLVTAVARLHEFPTDMWHGAIAPERIIITPEGRLVLVDHGLGTALEHLRFSHERYWKELRIALPQAIGLPRFDHRADVTQVGVVALALILGRPLADDDYPGRIGQIADGAAAVSSERGAEPLPAPLRLWLFRALQLDPLRPFASAVEARSELSSALGDAANKGEDSALSSFMLKYHAAIGRDGDAASAAKSPAPAKPVPAAAPSAAATPASVPPAAPPAPPAPAPAQPFWGDRAAASQSMQKKSDERPADALRVPAMPRRRLAIAAVVVLTVASGAMVAGRRLLTPTVEAEVTGTVIVNTNPAGIAVAVDGQHRGMSPLTMTVSPGPHMISLVSESGVRKIPVTVTAGGEVSQFIEMPVASPLVGHLQVRTEPSGAKVTVDGHYFGAAPLTVESLTPGPHTVLLESDLGSFTEKVTIEGGVTASLVVPLRAPAGAPVSGWFSVSAPADLQVFENGQLLGSSRLERIMVSAGRHELELVNEALGFRATRTIQVAPGKTSQLRPEWPTGTLSINAVPWAEVWINGDALGETPIGSVSLPIGTHTVVFRHPELGEQRATATVTVKAPARLSVDLRKK